MLKLFILIVGGSFISCTPKETNDIYLCGNSSTHKAFYVVNGLKTELSPNCYEAQVIAIEVVNGNVYCAGHIREQKDGKTIAVIWKNGIARRLTDGSCSAYIEDMYIADDIVCCVGREADGPKIKEPRKQYSFYDHVVQHDQAKVWIIQRDNPIKELVLTNGKYNASVKSVYIDSDRRLHLVGYDEGIRAALIGTLDAYFQTRYWLLSGEDWELSQENSVFNQCGQATLIFGADSNLYICGWVDYDLHSTDGINATYWQNGWEKKLPENYEVIS